MLQMTDGKPLMLKIYRTLKTHRPSGHRGDITVEGRHIFIDTADQQLEVVELQMEGKRRMAASDFLNGLKDKLTTAHVE
jgi:methionyl-tRNA formyltransferase